MKQSKKCSKLLAWIITVCIMIPFAVPILAYADSDLWSIAADGKEISLEIAPYENELGLMLDAEAVSKVFDLNYIFDAENKAFTISDDLYGEIVLMHNATQFISGDKTYDCAPYFYVENGIPMVELGFFCDMFSSSYEIDGTNIIINKNVLSDNVARILINDEETPLYVEPYQTELGLIVPIADIAKAFGVGFEFNSDDNSSKLKDEEHGEIILNDKAEKFTSNAGEFECKPYYLVENEIPFVEAGFFCEMFGASYDYEEDTKLLIINKDRPFLYDEDENSLMSNDISIMSAATLSGKVSYSSGAPSDGLDVKLILRQIGTRYVVYQGNKTYTGQSYVLGTVHINPGQTYQNYSYDVSKYYSSTYPSYNLFFEESRIKSYGYYNTSNSTTALSSSPMHSSMVYSTAKSFSSNSSYKANIDMDSGLPSISGNISLENNYAAPTGGLDVDLILQTRSATYTWSNIYGGKYTKYDIGKTYKIGTRHFNKEEKSKEYNYIISKYYTDNSYPYYTLLYSSENNDCVMPYGYYDNEGETKSMSISPLDSSNMILSSRAFDISCSSMADLVLPVKPGYSPQETVGMPTANYQSGSVEKGTLVKLSTKTSGATIYYTTDGSTPTTSSPIYSGSIAINSDTVIKAIAVKSGMISSNIATYTYLVNSDEYIKFVVGSNVVFAGGKEYIADAAPTIVNGSIYAPIIALSEVTEADCEWNGSLKQATFKKDGKSLSLEAGDGNCCIINDRTFADVCYVLKQLLGNEYEIVSTSTSVTAIPKNVNKPEITVGSVNGKPGQTVNVILSLSDNPGVISMLLNVGYDSNVLTLINVDDAGALGSQSHSDNFELNPYVLYWNNGSATENYVVDGKIVTLSFKIADTAEEGSYPITVSYDKNNDAIFDVDFNAVDFKTVDGKVTVSNTICGDINGDGKVTALDNAFLSRYFAKWKGYDETAVDLSAADTNGDERVTALDNAVLARHLAKWKGYNELPYIK